MSKEILYINILNVILEFFSEMSIFIFLLFICNIIDIITGISVSFYLKKKITYKKLLLGLIKKISIYFLIICGYIFDLILIYTVENFDISLQNNLICGLLSTWLILNEQISIISNLIILKVPVPNFILKLITKFQNKIDYKIKK